MKKETDWTGHHVYFELKGTLTDSTVLNTGEAGGEIYTKDISFIYFSGKLIHLNQWVLLLWL